MDAEWDCIVVGGGAAGLSAALVLGRARRRTLVVDAGGQSNRGSDGVGGFLGQDHRAPADFYAAGAAELATYPTVRLRDGEVAAGAQRDGGFALTLADGAELSTRTVLLATGMDYRYPELSGVAARWGHSVFHCPFCHGWEVRERPLGVLGSDAAAVQRSLLLRAWSDDVTLFTDGAEDPEPDALAQLAAANVAVEPREVAELVGAGRELTGVRFADGSTRSVGGLLVAVRLHQRSGLAAQLGAALAEPNPMVADGLVVDGMFRTPVAGLSAVGDLAGQMPSVANAVAGGSNAAAMLVHDLMAWARA